MAAILPAARRKRIAVLWARQSVFWTGAAYADPEPLDVPAFSLSAQPAAVTRPRKTRRMLAVQGSRVFGIQMPDFVITRSDARNQPDQHVRDNLMRRTRRSRRNLAALESRVYAPAIFVLVNPDTAVTPSNRNNAVGTETKQPHVHLHAAYWPYHRLATLKNVKVEGRAQHWLNYGPASFTIARNDPAFTNAKYALQRGAWVVIESNKAQPWVGFIRVVSESLDTADIRCECSELAGLLDVKVMRQSAQITAASGGIFKQVMRDYNARGHTGIFLPSVVEPGPRVTIDLAGETAFNALNEMAERTGYEWWVEAEVASAYIKAQIQWGYRQGFDNAKMVRLYEGRHFADLDYRLDTRGARQSVTMYGGVGELSERSTVTRAASSTPGAQLLGDGFEPAGASYDRALDVPPALRSEDVFFRVMTSDRTELSMEAQRQMERGLATSESGTAMCNSNFDWRTIGPGDFIQLITHNTGLGAINRKVRVTGLQPDEANGQLTLTWETPLR